MDRGDLVPDEVIIGVIAERVQQSEASDGFILDGFPRTLPQAEALDAKMDELGRRMTAAILIEVPDEEVMRRLGGRRTCEENGHVFHLEFNPPEKEGVCDIDGSPLMIRDDDKPEVIKHRLEQYRSKTEPLIEYYEERGILQPVNGVQAPDVVEEKIHGADRDDQAGGRGLMYRGGSSEDAGRAGGDGCGGRDPGSLPADASLQVPARDHHRRARPVRRAFHPLAGG